MVNSITARFRVSCALVCMVLPAISGCAFEDGSDADEDVDSIAQGLATDATVYTNAALASGWQSWSWSTTAAFGNTEAPLASGSTSHIKATVSSVGGALSLAHAAGDVNAADYASVSFDIRAASSSNVRLALETLAGGGSGVGVTVPVTTTWTRKTIDISSLQGSLSRFGKIDWIATQSGQTFYVDNVKLVAKVIPVSSTTSSTTSTFPASPLTVQKSNVVTLNSSASPYALYVPASYDATHRTPTKLLVWLHGCGGQAYGDAWSTSPGGAQSWITVSVGGRDGACWNMGTDSSLVLAALDDVRRRLNIDPRRVVIGGYSSGGNLAYRTAFYNAKRFAGVIAEDTAPFYGTGSSQSSSIGAAAWKLNVVHLAHLSDTTFSISTVRSETDALRNAGFPTNRIERAGTHWDPDTSSSGTNYDMRTYLLGYLDAGWTAPL